MRAIIERMPIPIATEYAIIRYSWGLSVWDIQSGVWSDSIYFPLSVMPK